MNMTPRVIATVAGAVVAGVVGLSVIGGAFYTIDEGSRGVILRTGKVVGTATPGLGFKLPVVDSVVEMNVQSLSQVYEGVLAYSADQQTAAMKISVNFRVPADQVSTVYSDYGSIDGMLQRLVDRQVPEEVKGVFGKFTAATAIKERERLSAEINAAIKKSVTGPIIIESVQLENLDFSDAYEKSIEQRMLAEVEVQKVLQNAEREKVQAGIKVIQAQAEADSKLAQAKAEADAIKLRGEAEAQAIRQRGAALAQNPNLVDLVKAERWDGVLPTTMIPGGATPMLNVSK
jgi:regulator of protease activity HflC (stomatin/prohibitin superfamily)